MVASAPAAPSAKTRPPVRRSAVDKAGGRVCPEYVGATSERRFGRHTSLSRVLAPLQLRGAFRHALSVSLALLCSLLRAVVRREEPGLARALAKMAAARDLWVVAVATQLTKKGKVLAHVRLVEEIGFCVRAQLDKPFDLCLLNRGKEQVNEIYSYSFC